MVNRFSTQRGLKLPQTNIQSTPVELEIIHLLTEEFLTIKQVAQRRKTSLQAVYKVIKRLKKKGLLNINLKKVEKVEPTYNQSDIRLHAQEFNIKIIWQNNKYQELLNKSNTLFLDSNTIRLYKNSLEIYSGQSFYGRTTNEAEGKSLRYWERFLTRLEHDLKVCLIKNRSRNIKIVNQHWARGDSEICNNSKEYGERVWVYAEEDGKLCFITDDSFGFKEDETLHPLTAKPDRKAIDKQVNDWRLRDPPTNSELAQNQEQIGNNINGLLGVVSKQGKMILGLPKMIVALEMQIKSHLALIQEYRKENRVWRKNKTKEIKKELREGRQSELGEFS